MAGGAGAVRAGAAYIEIFANDSKFQQSLKKMEGRLKATAATMRTIGTGLVTVGTAIAGPIIAAAGAFANLGSEIYDMSQRTGIAAESLSVLRYAAQQTGTDVGAMENAVKFMQKAVVNAGKAGSPAAKALGAIGLTAQQLQGLKPEEQMAAIADGLMQIQDPAQRTAIAVAIFGKAGTAVLPMLAEGSAGLSAFAKEAAALGLVMDTETAAKADRLGDAIDKLKQAAFMAFIKVGGAVAPALTEIAETLAITAAAVGNFITRNKELVGLALKVGAAILAAGGAFMVASFMFSTAAQAIGVFRAAMSIIPALLSPTGLAIAGVALAVTGLVIVARTLSPAFRKETDAIMAAIMKLDFATAWDLIRINLAIALTKMAKAVAGFLGYIKNAFTAAAMFVGDKLVEGLDRFMGLFGADILTLQGGLEKLGLYFRAAFDWKWAVTSLRGALKEVDARMKAERKRNPTANDRADARADARQRAADERQRQADESEQGWNDTLDSLNEDLKRAHDKLKPKPEKEAGPNFKPGVVPDIGAAMAAAQKDKGFSTLGTFGSGEGLGIGPELAAMADPAKQTAENTSAIADILESMEAEGMDVGTSIEPGRGAAADASAVGSIPAAAEGAQAATASASQSLSLPMIAKAGFDSVVKAIIENTKVAQSSNGLLSNMASAVSAGLRFS